MQPRRSAPKERDNVTAARDPGRVMAILYSRLAASLRSLAIILPIHLHLLSLASTFATVSCNYHTYAYEAERRRTCPDTKAEWDADTCSEHFRYRPKGKVGTRRPIPMASVELLAARFYRLKSGHAPTGVYLKWFSHRDDDKCWWCGGTVSQTREHLFRHCSRWKEQQKTLWKVVGRATGWKAGRCRHVQISELFTIAECDQAVIDFLAATEFGKFPPK